MVPLSKFNVKWLLCVVSAQRHLTCRLAGMGDVMMRVWCDGCCCVRRWVKLGFL